MGRRDVPLMAKSEHEIALERFKVSASVFQKQRQR
jgi:hypothetical protein